MLKAKTCLCLSLNFVAYVFDCLAHLALCLTPSLLSIAARAIGFAFLFKFSIVGSFADIFFDSTLGPVKFSFNFVEATGVPVPVQILAIGLERIAREVFRAEGLSGTDAALSGSGIYRVYAS